MTNLDPESAAYLERARERIRRTRQRQTAWLFLVLGPYALGIVAIRALGPHDYPAGDYRNEPLFWVLFALLALLIWGTFMTLAIRRLRVGGDAADVKEPPRDIGAR